MPKLIYIHGFNSSEQSEKAEKIKQRCEQMGCADVFISPRLPWEPNQAIHLLSELIEKHLLEGVTLCGSSLGGFYATYLSQKYTIKSVLVNPAVGAYNLLEQHLGEQFNPYTQESYVLKQEHMQQLLDLEVTDIDDALFWLMLQEGDETLDYKKALQKYPTVKTLLESNGSHRFEGFERFIDDVLSFAEII
ncbi:hypothetical protein CBF23_012355 [Marinomonas agarivorans]|nr:hypothetical protein CBF23_012355 [Marinomonas agarivorans]